MMKFFKVLSLGLAISLAVPVHAQNTWWQNAYNSVTTWMQENEFKMIAVITAAIFAIRASFFNKTPESNSNDSKKNNGVHREQTNEEVSDKISDKISEQNEQFLNILLKQVTIPEKYKVSLRSGKNIDIEDIFNFLKNHPIDILNLKSINSIKDLTLNQFVLLKVDNMIVLGKVRQVLEIADVVYIGTRNDDVRINRENIKSYNIKKLTDKVIEDLKNTAYEAIQKEEIKKEEQQHKAKTEHEAYSSSKQQPKTELTEIEKIINKFPERLNANFVSNFIMKEKSDQARIIADFNQKISELENIVSEELKKDHVDQMVSNDLGLIAKIYLEITFSTDDYRKAEQFDKKVKEFGK